MSLDNTVWDSSGYENNGTCTNSLNYNTDSVKGNYCIKLENDIQLNNAHNLKTIFNSSSFSINMYVRLITTSTSKIPIIFMGEQQSSKCVQLGIDFTSGHIYFGFYNEDIVESNFKISTILDEWIMVTCTYNKDTKVQKIYINGDFENQNTSQTTPYIETNIFTIKKGIDCYVDDIKIYCTCLDNDYISDMYKVKTRFDRYGNIYSSEFVESEDITNINVNTKYVLTSGKFTEGKNYISMNKTDKNINLNELIEI